MVSLTFGIPYGYMVLATLYKLKDSVTPGLYPNFGEAHFSPNSQPKKGKFEEGFVCGEKGLRSVCPVHTIASRPLAMGNEDSG